ncbi:Rxt3-domain-containing protein [Microthyrium microscopicum]|uniref:Rxt3-domain-containing protein n=1 Tax=Microthyrium microscopicum TaxID=703497 RepID=A0A6A6UC17_9PEZI|nr:Rxt3-domain-containing protein [Microthyrium microscopicum]
MSKPPPPPPPPPPSYTPSRELPSLGSSSRQGTGMSISSLLGDAPPQPPRSQHGPSQQTATHMRPPSPRRHQPSASASRGQWGRPATPERNTMPPSSRMPDGPQYGSASSPQYYVPGPPQRESPEYSRNPTPNYHSHPTPPRHQMYHGSPQEVRDGRPGDDRGPPRPPSQPSPFGMPRNQEYHDQTVGPRPPPFGGNIMQRNPSQEGPPPQGPYSDRGAVMMPGDRPISAQPLGLQSYQPVSRPQDDNNLLRRNLMGQDPLREESRRGYGQPKKEEPSGPMRTGFRGQYYTQPPTSAPVPEAPRSHPQPYDPTRPAQEQYTAESMHAFNRPLYEHEQRRDGRPPVGLEMRPGTEPPQRRQSGEEMQASRSFLGISSDPNKRGRASPLPQAVKGAQARYDGPGQDPSIKSEFGRIFQGLGSGLGGVGSLTPSRQSPVPQGPRDNAPITLSDNDGAKMSRAGSRGGRGGPRGRMEDEDGRRTPLGSGGRGGKRARQTLHQQVLDQRFDDESPTATRSTNFGQPQASVPLPPPIPKPVLSIDSTSVLKRAAEKPRNHLGNALYQVRFKAPPFASVALNDRDGYYMQWEPPRRFSDEDDNCTYTIRVPREYLIDDMRIKLQHDRYLYGSELHTDDSDPLLAAIHGGWIRGAWPSDVDESLLDIPPAPPADAPVVKELTKPLESPPVPPKGLDCHITILVLPPLVDYSSSVRFGLKSRHWGNNHDGRSFMILAVDWVDEGFGRFKNGKGSKKRVVEHDAPSNEFLSKRIRSNGLEIGSPAIQSTA